MKLKDKAILITGAAQGLGETTAHRLARDGAFVILADINIKAAEQVAKKIGNNAAAVYLDISSKESIEKGVYICRDKFKKIDVLINNAAIDVTEPIEKLSIGEIDTILRINLLGPYILSKLILEHMYKQRSGHVVNIASTAAFRAWPNASAYHASKWGLLGLSRSLYTEARQHNVKVSTVIPGGMRTPFILSRFPDTDLNKLQDPAAVAESIHFVLTQPSESIIAEIVVLPLLESSWP